MTRVRSQISVSLDGFVAGPNQSLEVEDGHASDGPPTMRGCKSVETRLPLPPSTGHSDTFDARSLLPTSVLLSP